MVNENRMQIEICNVEQQTLGSRQPQRRAIAIRFGKDADEVVRSRIRYAVQTFCAVYHYRYDAERERDSLTLSYGCDSQQGGEIHLPAGYTPRPLTEMAPEPSFISVDEQPFPRFHPTSTGKTDWLGELFEWISAADEQAVVPRDSAGRIPYSASLHSRYQLDPCVPFASLAMHQLNELIEKHSSHIGSKLAAVPPNSCSIVATHDIDFLPVSSLGTLKRFLKNIAIAMVAYRDPGLAGSIFLAGMRRLGTKSSVLDCLPAMLERERQLGIQSTCNFLCRQEHRRDANYRIDEPTTISYLKKVAQSGAEIGLHGSYNSLETPGLLAEEYRRLSQLGYHATGGRQHWLRYQNTSLFSELSQAGAVYDSSVGYSEHIGFRTGACFAYAPYNFQEEAAFPLLEIPLVVMDSALYCESRDPEIWTSQCQKVLQAVRRYGRGGVSILWHDTVFGGGQLPQGIADLYWDLKSDNEKWHTAKQLVAEVWPQFVDAQLLSEQTRVQAA